jgi:type II secretory pathway component PulJ
MSNGSLNKRVLQSVSLFSLILLVTSLLSTSYIQNSKALPQEDEETAYLKLVTQTVNDSNNSGKNSSSAPVKTR